jgi:hypothetical protein
MSKKHEIDDKDLDRMSGAGDGTQVGSGADDDTGQREPGPAPPDLPVDPPGGSGPGPENVDSDADGLQHLA